MNLFAFFILPTVGNFFLTYICFYFMSKIGRNIYLKKRYYISIYMVFSIITNIVSWAGNGLLNFTVISIGLLVSGHFLYNNTRVYKLYYLLFSVCLFLCDGLSSLIIGIGISQFNLYIKDLFYYQILMVVLIRLSEFVYVNLAILFINKRSINILKLKQIISFMIIPLFSMVYIFTLFNYMQMYSSNEDLMLFIVNVTLIFAINVYVTYIFDNISKNNELQNEINLYQQKSNLQYKYYDSLEEKYMESRKLAHDIRNHLNTIEELYKANNTKEAKEYTNDIHKMLNKLNQKYYTSNRVLNIILNDKFNEMKKYNIDIDCRIGDVDLSFIRDIDMVTIFANLLDNSIEAVSESNEEKYIKLDIDKFNELIVINIINPIINKPIYKNGKFKSTKENHNGLGIENVKKSLEKHDGTMVVDYTENEFKVNIVIPI
ncbi:sensor histidine kinase [Paraclostridium bifermentans]|uniref:sensor histidine kinase n=1 Tax=Paraclostridium bifermentans TaxID=1490 RepID=UPI00359C1070